MEPQILPGADPEVDVSREGGDHHPEQGCGGWTWKETVEDGKWAALSPEPVLVPATFGYANGVWYRVKQGMQGVLVRDRTDRPVVFMVTEPATRYYRVMTRAEWMPALVGEVI